ncbi:MAG TPA: type II CAAX endopeptidase family protein [Longimicrobiaceae bacterium]|nr:type II CAAX endopeptidase family protein [Longimicrobiaceae bacterium]
MIRTGIRGAFGAIAQAVGISCVALLWGGVIFSFAFFRPAIAVAWLVGAGVAFLAFALWPLPPREAERRRGTLRLRSPGRAVLPLLLAGPVFGVFSVCVVTLLTHAGIVHPPSTPAMGDVADYASRPGAWAPIALAMVVVAPLCEEFFFRGWVQQPLEQRFGAVAAVAITSSLFALAHGRLAFAPTEFVCGALTGSVVIVTSSIWSGVLVHGGANLVAFLLAQASDPRLGSPEAIVDTFGAGRLIAVAALSAGVLVCVVVSLARTGPHALARDAVAAAPPESLVADRAP